MCQHDRRFPSKAGCHYGSGDSACLERGMSIKPLSISYLLCQAACPLDMGHPGNKAADRAGLGKIKWPLLKLKGTQPSVSAQLCVPKATAEPRAWDSVP